MKIFGIGTDITDINRIKKLLKNKKFLKRIYGIEEINVCNKRKNKANCFAKRFAAKEAFSKALGIGISSGLNFKEIIIKNLTSGKPKIKLIGRSKIIFSKILKKSKYNIFLSLSDEKSFAVATVIISKWIKKNYI